MRALNGKGPENSDWNNQIKSAITMTKLETDYMGHINFCLSTSDTSLSGPSRSKVLNEITNDVFKALIIGYKPIMREVLQRIDLVYTKQLNTNLAYDDYVSFSNEQIKKVDDGRSSTVQSQKEYEKHQIQDLKVSLTYVNWLQSLLLNGTIYEPELGGVHDRFVDQLCLLLPTLQLNLEINKTEVIKGYWQH